MHRLPTIVTTNLAFKERGKLFHNVAAAPAIADRLVHNGLLVKIAGKSKRSDTEVCGRPRGSGAIRREVSPERVRALRSGGRRDKSVRAQVPA
jgi:hypothetical protein